MAKIKHIVSNKKNIYSDGDIEEKIYEIVENNQIENIDKYKNWAIMYHLSHLRENILSWYEFKKDCKILEIGSGCGAITSLFCRKADKVVSVELSDRRAKIAYNRNLKEDNLEIYVGNIFDINFEEKFDYVVFNGVFEYASSFIDTNDPFSDLIKHISKFTKEDSEIIIAIENRMGIKYFSGAREDHNGSLFYGLNGYRKDDYAVTFSKNEIENILKQCGYNYINFYYPFPDYKFPDIIIDDFWISNYNVNYNLYSFDYSRYMLFNEIEMQNKLSKELLTGYFANSFLLFASKVENRKNKNIKVIYNKVSANRYKKFRIYTQILKNDDEFYVKKIALTHDSKNVLKNMNKFYNSYKNDNIKLVNTDFDKDYEYCKYDFIIEKSFEMELIEILEKNNIDEFFNKIDIYYNNLVKKDLMKLSEFNKKNFTDTFGFINYDIEFNLSNISNIDMNLDNIFLIKDDKLLVIDYEWVFDFEIPGEYIFWRGIKNFFEKNIIKNILEDEIYCKYKITYEKISIFNFWENYFSNVYVGQIDLNKYSKNIETIDNSKEIFEKNKFYKSNLYIDIGNGFNDFDRVEENISIDGINEVIYDLTKFDNIHELRFDPIESISSSVKILSARYDNKEILLSPTNSISLKNNNMEDIFITSDPIYFIDIKNVSNRSSKLYIKYEIKELKINELYEIIDYMEKEINFSKNKISEYYKIVEALNIEIEERRKIIELYEIEIHEKEEEKVILIEKNKIKEEENTRLIEENKIKEEENTRLIEENKIKEEEKCKLENAIIELKMERLKIKEELEKIYYSRGWKYLTKIKKIFGK